MKKAVLSDDEEGESSGIVQEGEAGGSGEHQPVNEVVPDVSDDSDDEGIRDHGGYVSNKFLGKSIVTFSCRNDQGLSDFELMMQKKKEEQSKRRKRKDIDIINDNDDIIAQLLADMRNAAEVCEEIQRKNTAIYYIIFLGRQKT